MLVTPPTGTKNSTAEGKSLKVFFPNLDGLRFFCFLSVFFFHSFGSSKVDLHGYALYRVVKLFLFKNGVLGVNFFFVLSGFLITYLLLLEKENFGSIKVLNFYKRRILRIWPLFYFCVIFGFFIFPQIKIMFGETPDEPARLGFYLTFLSNFDIVYNSSPDSSVLAILWSVSIEEQFYLIWPLIILLIPKRWLLQALATLILASFLYRLANADSYLKMTLHTFSCISDLIVGGLFAYMALYNNRFVEWIRKAPKITWIGLYLAVIIVYLFTRQLFQQDHFLYAIERLIISIIFGFVIIEQCYADNSLFKMSNFPIISRLGTYTFGLYCLHPIAGLIANKGLSMLGLNSNIYQIMFLETAVSLSLAILLAYVSYRFFESPFLRLKTRFARISKD